MSLSKTLVFKLWSWMNTHKADAAAHHVKYTDVEAVTATERKSGFYAHRITTQITLPHNTLTTVIFNTEDFDLEDAYNTGTGAFIVKTKGYYLIGVTLLYVDMNDACYIYVDIHKSGTVLVHNRLTTGGGGYAAISCSTIVLLDIGDNVQCRTLHQNGNDRNIYAAYRYTNYYTYLLEKF